MDVVCLIYGIMRENKGGDLMSNQTFSWTHGQTTLTFSDPCITFFPGAVERDRESTTKQSIMYYYYTVTLKNKRTRKTFRTHDFPKVLDLPAAIDELLNLNLEESGAVLEETRRGDFHRVIRYQQLCLEDSFGLLAEYFIKLERYDYAVKQAGETDNRQWSQYHLLIGEPLHPYQDEGTADCLYLYDLEAEDLLQLKAVAEAFIEHSVQLEIQRELAELKEKLEI